jgi:hypothetical protein
MAHTCRVLKCDPSTPDAPVDVEINYMVHGTYTRDDFPDTFTLEPSEFTEGMFVTWPRARVGFKSRGEPVVPDPPAPSGPSQSPVKLPPAKKQRK